MWIRAVRRFLLCVLHCNIETTSKSKRNMTKKYRLESVNLLAPIQNYTIENNPDANGLMRPYNASIFVCQTLLLSTAPVRKRSIILTPFLSKCMCYRFFVEFACYRLLARRRYPLGNQHKFGYRNSSRKTKQLSTTPFSVKWCTTDRKYGGVGLHMTDEFFLRKPNTSANYVINKFRHFQHAAHIFAVFWHPVSDVRRYN